MEEGVKMIDAIKFSVFSPNEIRRYSVAEISAPETYDEDGMPVTGGLMDSRLGTLEPGQKCATCGNTYAKCPGHFGHIELAEPVLHIAFVEDIRKILVSTCRFCGRLLLPQEEIDLYRAKLAEKKPYTPTLAEEIAKEILAKIKKVKVCPHCNKPRYEIEFTKPTTFHEITEWGGATRLLPSAIRERLERVPDDDLRLLGYDPSSTRPEWFVLQVLPVPPVCVRPSITLESGIRSEDDLTHKLVDILRVNQRVKESKEAGTPPLIVQDLVDLLQYQVTTYFDNEVSGIPQARHRSGRPLKTLSQRLKGKEGRFRGSLSGKRVDFSSRTVISPDTNLDICEVGLPYEVAKKLTIPEKAAPWNIEFLKQLVLNGPEKYPGANYVIRPDGVKIRLDYASDRAALAESLGPGYIVERHLMDGDVVLFNRQPSLHRMSIMAHFVKVLPYRTFRLHPAVCPPYNADFDGDEMNLHVPQSEEARAEALMLMRVQDQIISPRYGGPIIGAIRDYLTAAYLLTHDSTRLTKEEFTNLALAGGYVGPLPEPIEKTPEPLYSGKQLFSLFLPKDFNYVMSSKWAKGNVKDVIVKNGELVSGVIDRAAIGAEEPNSLLHRLTKDYGTDEARRFLNSILAVLKAYITRRGFTYGYDDLELPEDVRKKIKEAIEEAYNEVARLFELYEKRQLPLVRGLSPEEALELYILNELQKARDRAGRFAERAFPESNPAVIMARTGARGTLLNIAQMAAALGQQSVRGRRIEKGYQDRALPHFLPGERSPDAKGFVKSNYRDGLNPVEFFFHAIGGREGLVDTAVRTQQSGYMQRRLVNAMEHLRVEYDLSVRDPYGHIIQFIYGEDGVDPAKSDHGLAVNVARLVETEALISKTSKLASEEEIKRVVSKYAKELNPKLIQDLYAALKEHPLDVKSVENVCKRVVELLKKAMVEPGEAIGVVAAQSVGEPGTQMTLRTFHFAGVREKDVTLGLPRLIELVDARKQPSKTSMTVYIDPDYAAAELKKAEEENKKTWTKLSPEELEKEKNRVLYQVALKVAKQILFTKVSDLIADAEVDYVNGAIVLRFDKSKLAERDCTLHDVKKAIETSKRKVDVDEASLTLTVHLAGLDLIGLNMRLDKLLNMRVKGIPGVERVTVEKEGDEWLIRTSGSNFSKTLKVEGVDRRRTITNNVFEIATVLGIEAARTALVKEIMSTLDEQGLEVDIRHIYLIADLMTAKGEVQQIGRHGVAGAKTSILARAAFEITVPTLAEAAVKGEVEELKGVTENVIVGLPIPVGTGMVDLFMQGEAK
jgi:DNA-directed RNA polymerase subunit A'